MEPVLTADQELFAATTRRFLDNEAGVDVLRRLRDDPRGHDAAYWRQGCELGWTSLLVAERDGGGSVSGEGVRDLALVAYEVGRHASPGPLIGCNVVAAALSRSGTQRQKDEVLGGILTGEIEATWAFAEPRPDDGLGTIAMAAMPAPSPSPGGGDRWSLTGTKVQVESAATASHMLATARAPEGPTQFLVPLDAPGVTVRPMRSVDLTRRFSSVRFDAVDAGADAVVGEVGGADDDVAWQLRLANVVQCAEMVGALDAAMDLTLEWVMDRYSFGRPLGSYQAIKHRLADMKTWLEASHALADGAAAAVQRDAHDADEMCSGAKAYIGHHGPELCQECVQFHGGIGVTFDHDLHLYLRRVVLHATTYGTVTDHRLRLTDILEARDAQDAEGAA
jgi:alkylation response protein AidB-like acyl-CoA dehydrogenase